jgi:hypothetical protein
MVKIDLHFIALSHKFATQQTGYFKYISQQRVVMSLFQILIATTALSTGCVKTSVFVILSSQVIVRLNVVHAKALLFSTINLCSEEINRLDNAKFRVFIGYLTRIRR